MTDTGDAARGMQSGDLGDRPRTKDAVATQGEIMRSAARFFAQRGFAHVTLREIADDAGITPALIVRYFGSKRALFELIVQSRASFEEVDVTQAPQVLAKQLMAYWLDPDAAAPALAAVRSIDLDDGAILRAGIEQRIGFPLLQLLGDSDDSIAKIRLFGSLAMGVGLFGAGGLIAKPGEDLTPGIIEAMERRLADMIEACLRD